MEIVTAVRVVKPYILDVTFADGVRRQVDVEPVLNKPVFAPLRNPRLFAEAAVDPVLGTVVWPNGADLAPEFLYWGPDGPPPGYYDPRDETDETKPAERETGRAIPVPTRRPSNR